MDLLGILMFIFMGHFLGDFLLQSKWMRENKHDNIVALVAHTFTYGVILGLIAFVMQAPFGWVVFNFFAHGFVDFITSKASHYYFSKEDYWNGMNIVGIDQLIHILILLTTLFVLYK